MERRHRASRRAGISPGLHTASVLDVNGNGTPDLFWDNSMVTPQPAPGAPIYQFLDFVGELKPNLLTVNRQWHRPADPHLYRSIPGLS